jgi:DNA polymerase-3 subunit delta
MVKKDDQADTGYRKLKADLRAKQPGNFYILYGEEAYLRNYTLSLLKKQIVEDLTAEFNCHRFTQENFSIQALADSVEAYPMMAERSFVQVDELDLFHMTESDREKMISIFSDIPDYCCLVLTYETTEFKPDKRQKKLWDIISTKATIAEFRKQGERELCDWIARHFAALGKSISPELCRYLVVQTGGAMTLLDGEIAKIAAYTGEAQVTKPDIDAVVEPVLDAVVFDISNAIAAGNFDMAIAKLRTLLQKQEEPIPIVAAIGAQMRRLYCAKILSASGKGADSLMQLCGLSEYPAKLTMTQSRKLPDRFCRQAVLECLATDEALKSGVGDPQEQTLLLVLRLAQEASA